MAIVGIDIGGTKTQLRFEAGDTQSRDMIVPTRDWRRSSSQADVAALHALVSRLADGRALDAVAIGAHGCDDDEECRDLHRAYANHHKGALRVVNDSELIPAAMDMPGEIGVVAGTGSIAVARDEAGRMVVAGGWGWVIGDEGSASGLVREAAYHASRHLDSGGSDDEPLVRHLLRSLGLTSTTRLGSAIAETGSAAVLGSHAMSVFAAAEEGSVLAQKTIHEGGLALAGLVRNLLDSGVKATRAVAGGGVITVQPPLAEAFRFGMARVCRGVTPVLIDRPPVAGACVLARALLRQAD